MSPNVEMLRQVAQNGYRSICGVCMGHSPSWDGHDRGCSEWVRQQLTELLDGYEQNESKWDALDKVQHEAMELRAQLAGVEELIEQARKVSPSESMTIYVGDLEHALGLRAEPVKGIVG